jgi:hypothetical protein
LRANGWSLGRIALKLAVSKSSVSVWVRDVPIARPEPFRRVQLPIISGALKTCGRCRRTQPVESFNRHPVRDRQHWCRECFKAYFRQRGSRHREQVATSKRKRRAAARRHIRAVLANTQCMDCGEAEPELLDFDHVRGKKRTELSVLVCAGYPRRVLDEEMAKCEIVCASCHRKRTGIRQRSWRAVASEGGDPPVGLRPRQARNLLIVLQALRMTGCIDCGECDVLALEFDHLRDKRFNVPRGIYAEFSVARMREEIGKCEVVCANCHRRRTNARRLGGQLAK